MKDLSAKVNENSSFQIHFLKERIGHHETLEKALSYYFNRKRFNVEADKILDESYDNKEQ